MPREFQSADEMMTVAQLIEQLSQLPQDLIVVTDGYKDGYHDVKIIEQIEVELNVNSAWYYGPHDEYNEKKSPNAEHHTVVRIC